jgi:hypothetical protein
MAMSSNQIVGIVLLVLGLLLLLGWIGIPFLGTIIGIVLVVVGVMALIGAGPMKKNVVLGVVLLVLGVLVLVPWLGIGAGLGHLLETIVAIALVVVGILKIMDKM